MAKTMNDQGVLTIAYGKPKYVQQAITLARSIRLRDADLPLAVATDFPPAAFAGYYDQVIPWDFSAWPELVSKLELYAITPFATTLFLDADCLVVQSLQQVFDYFAGQQFAVFGRNDTNAIWFRTIDAIQAAVPSPTYPVFNGGLYYFTKSTQAEAVFQRARRLFYAYDELQLNRSRTNRENEEPLISLAMAQAGLQATSDPRLDILHAPERPKYQIQIDVLAGECQFIRQGRLVKPIITHFVGVRDRLYAYQRETLQLEVAFRWPFFPYYHERIVQLIAYTNWLLAEGLPSYRRQLMPTFRNQLRLRTRLKKVCQV